MKVFVPRNIDKWWFNMNFQIWPISVSLVQLVIVALWSGAALLTRNTIMKNGWWKPQATFMAIVILIPFLVVAFWNISELTLIPFIAKMYRNRFLDTTKKLQTNDAKIDPLQVKIKSSRATYEDMAKKEQKTLSIDDFKNKKPLSSDEILS